MSFCKRLRITAVLTVTLCGTVSFAAEPGAQQRAYWSEVAMTRIEKKGVEVETHMKITGAWPKPGAKITQVMYRWHYANPPKDLRVQLCQMGGQCIDASKSPERLTQNFAGANPSQSFYFRAMVPGTGDLVPLQGHRTATLTVQWYD
jgi:hypothetical protein